MNKEMLPPAKPKRKRKTRSDKGKKRSTKKVEIKSDVTKKPSKYLFDELVKNGQWYMQVKDNLCSRSLDDAFVIEFMLAGTRYTYRKYFADPTVAYTIGAMHLEYCYKNRCLYQ